MSTTSTDIIGPWQLVVGDEDYRQVLLVALASDGLALAASDSDSADLAGAVGRWAATGDALTVELRTTVFASEEDEGDHEDGDELPPDAEPYVNRFVIDGVLSRAGVLEAAMSVTTYRLDGSQVAEASDEGIPVRGERF